MTKQQISEAVVPGLMPAWRRGWVCDAGSDPVVALSRLGKGLLFFLLLLPLLPGPPLLSWLPPAAAPGWWDKGLFLDWEALEQGGIASVATVSF